MKENEIYSVENAKVVERNYKFYDRGERGFLKSGDALVNVVVTGIIIDFRNQTVTTKLMDKNKTEYIMNGDFDLFRSPESFENNEPLKRRTWPTFELLRRADIRRLLECTFYSEKGDENNPSFTCVTVWTFENGEAHETPVVINSIAIEDEGSWHLLDGSIPDKFWESRKDAYDCNEYKIVDEDGEVFIEEGFQKRLDLTTEQRAIFKEIKELLNKAKSAGIKLLWDRDNSGCIEAINMQNVQEIGYDIMATDGGQLIPLKEVIKSATETYFYDYCGCDCCDSVALKPTERQKKLYLKEHPEAANK